jgi:hypothetical protein
MIVRAARLLFSLTAVALTAYTFAQIAVHWPQLPPTVPSNITADGSAHGAMPAWALVVAPVIEAVVTIPLLARVPLSGRYPRTDRGWAALWFALACGFGLVAYAEWIQIDAALRPQHLHPMQWYTYAFIAGIVAGALGASLDSRRTRENPA